MTTTLGTALAAATFLAFGISGWRMSRNDRSSKSSGAAGGLHAHPTAPSTMKSGEPV
jgi:hypothetical protein